MGGSHGKNCNQNLNQCNHKCKKRNCKKNNCHNDNCDTCSYAGSFTDEVVNVSIPVPGIYIWSNFQASTNLSNLNFLN